MPITQGQMIEQMQEARAQHTALVQLREALSAYFQSAKERYPQNVELQEVLQTALYTIQAAPVPDDRATYVNERHYSRRAKWNVKAQADQERKRRILGIPEKKEAMNILHARNAASRNLAIETTLASDPFVSGGGKSDQEREAERLLAELDIPDELAVQMPIRTYSRPGLRMPRDDPDDPELEFETPEELAPIANLPAGAVAIVDPLAGENNSPKGLDNPVNLPDDSNGNPAKES